MPSQTLSKFLPGRRPCLAVLAAAVILSWGPRGSAQSAPGPIRTVLRRQDTTAPGYEAVLVKVEIPVGGREGRHTHPGIVMGYVQQGILTLDYEGRPTKEYKPGEAFVLEAGKIHEGINKGKVPIIAVATFVVKKGEALTIPAK